jgi:hypothetical protein
MKINGKILKAVIETLVIPRNGEDVVFRMQPVTDYSGFDALCKRPEAPPIKDREGNITYDLQDPIYVTQNDIYQSRKSNWIIKESLKATEGLEWSTVEDLKPETWDNVGTELASAGFSTLQVNAIINKVIEACGLDGKKIEEATKRFILGQAKAANAQ